MRLIYREIENPCLAAGNTIFAMLREGSRRGRSKQCAERGLKFTLRPSTALLRRLSDSFPVDFEIMVFVLPPTTDRSAVISSTLRAFPPARGTPLRVVRCSAAMPGISSPNEAAARRASAIITSEDASCPEGGAGVVTSPFSATSAGSLA